MKKLKVEIFAGERGDTQIRLLEELAFEHNGREYTIPAGFISDGASVPRFFWRLVDPPLCGPTLIPSVRHDYIYRTRPAIMTRKEADSLYYRELLANGYARRKCFQVYLAVRLFGRSSWQKQGTANDHV